MIIMTNLSYWWRSRWCRGFLYKFFSSEKTHEEINFENDLSKIEEVFSMSDSCIIRPSLTPNIAAKLPKNKVIIGKS